MQSSGNGEPKDGRAPARLLAWLTAAAMIIGLALIPATTAQAGGSKDRPDSWSGVKTPSSGYHKGDKPRMPRHRAHNPELEQKCALNIAVVVDNSGSIAGLGGAAAVQSVKDATTGVMDALVGSGAVVSLIHFSSTATVDVDSQPIVSQTDVKNWFAPKIRDFRSGGSTNWQDALIKVQSLSTTPDLVLFATDGRPNTIDGSTPGTSVVPADYRPAPADFSQTALAAAVTEANAVKNAGSRMFVVAFGAASSPNPPTDAFGDTANRAISGDRLLAPGGSVRDADYVRIGGVAALQTGLKALIAGLCTSIDKKSDPDGKVRVNSTIDYKVTLKNSSKAPITSDLVDVLPVGVTYVPGSASPAEPTVTRRLGGGQTLKWENVSVSAGGRFVARYQVEVDCDVARGTVLTNKATWNLQQDSTSNRVKGKPSHHKGWGKVKDCDLVSVPGVRG